MSRKSKAEKRRKRAEKANDVDGMLARKSQIEAPCDPSQFRILKRIAANPQNRLVIGLGGGSMHGLAGNCALLALLEELEIKPDIAEVWGTSAGAVVGGGWASGASPAKVLDAVAELAELNAVDFAKWEVLAKGLVRFLLFKQIPQGLVWGRTFRSQILTVLQVPTIEDCSVPFRAIACTDDGMGRKIALSEGPLDEAIAASMCIPGIVMPVRSWSGDDYGYFDGGIVEKTPLISIIEEHKRLGREENLVILCTHFGNDSQNQAPKGFLERFISTISIMEDMIWSYQVEEARKFKDVKFIVLNPHMTQGGMFEFEMTRFNYLWGRERFKEQLSNAKLGSRFASL